MSEQSAQPEEQPPASPVKPVAIVEDAHLEPAHALLDIGYEVVPLSQANGQIAGRDALFFLSAPRKIPNLIALADSAATAKILEFKNGETPATFVDMGSTYEDFLPIARAAVHTWDDYKAAWLVDLRARRAELDREDEARALADEVGPIRSTGSALLDDMARYAGLTVIPADEPHDEPHEPTENAADEALASVLEAERHSQVFSLEPATDAWPVPNDLWGGAHLPEVRPEWLPAPIADYLLDRAQIRGLDPCQVVVGGKTVCAGLIQESICLHMGDEEKGWREHARLWGAIVGDPSVRKGAGDDITQGALKSIASESRADEERAKVDYTIAQRIYEQELQTHIRAKAKGEQHNRPAAPEPRLSTRLWTENATTEAVALLLQHHARGKIMLLKDELAGWFGSFDAYGNGKSDKDRPDWLSAYEGKERYIDRARDGGHAIHVPSWSVGILGGIQPSVLASVAKKLGNDGMLQRFQIVVSRSATAGEDRRPDASATDRWERVQRNLLSLIYAPDQGPIRLSPEAQEFRRDCSRWLMQAMKAGLSGPLQAALGKWDGLLGRLTITAHCIHAADQGRPFPDRVVPLATIRQAWAYIREFLWPHAVHFYQHVIGSDDKHAGPQWVAGLILARGLQTISTTYLSRAWYGYRNLKTGFQRAQLWDTLVTAGWVRPIQGERVDRDLIGKIPTKYQVNPAVHDGRYAEQRADYQAQREQYAAVMRENMPSRRDAGED